MKFAANEFIRPGMALWQVSCTSCHSQYGLLHADEPSAPRPRLCTFCGHLAAFHRVDDPAADRPVPAPGG